MRKIPCLVIILLFCLSSILPVVNSIYVEKSTDTLENVLDNGLMDSAWPMFGHDNHHTGRSLYDTEGKYLVEKWRLKLAGNWANSPIIDRNGIQSDGSTEEIMGLEPLGDKWRSFGWNVLEVDGSNIREIYNAFEKAKRNIGRPSVVISYLIKGADVSFMEHTRKFHGRPPNKEEYELALEELNKIENELN